MLAPRDIHLGPLLVAAPAITVAVAGARLTALVGGLTLVALLLIGGVRGVLDTANIQTQFGALIVVSTLLVVFCLVRDRRERELYRVRSVAEAAQHVLLQPLPRGSGPLRLACLYLPAEAEAEMGGDLYAAARTTTGSTRLLIGDVRGKGLPAVSHAALLMGAFRAAAHRQATLPRLAVHLDGAVRWDTVQWRTEADAGEDEIFATAMILDIPDHEPVVHLISCGHPPALLIRRHRVVPLQPRASHLPIGLGRLDDPAGDEGGGGDDTRYAVETFGFEAGDLLLLYTDGVIEARDADGAFFPLAERAASWSDSTPEECVRRLREALTAHVHGHLGDDVAAVVIRREAA
ncbi:serine/threonine-protein phosphatase [Streptomyces sp. ISL-11]|nr:serine/threonine-protein phosphatase [Streptomyces sp. ISL-11]